MHKIFISRISDGREVQGDIHFYKGSAAIFSGKGDVIEEMDKAEIIEHSKFKTVVQGIQKDTGESMTWNATAKSFWRDDITLGASRFDGPGLQAVRAALSSWPELLGQMTHRDYMRAIYETDVRLRMRQRNPAKDDVNLGEIA